MTDYAAVRRLVVDRVFVGEVVAIVRTLVVVATDIVVVLELFDRREIVVERAEALVVRKPLRLCQGNGAVLLKPSASNARSTS